MGALPLRTYPQHVQEQRCATGSELDQLEPRRLRPAPQHRDRPPREQLRARV